ncbi:MAG: hypothetical protein GKR90_05930 [Pseudomonadales bacterium]|nr:hypothetical protein [Pseudomonadales bacterium]
MLHRDQPPPPVSRVAQNKDAPVVSDEKRMGRPVEMLNRPLPADPQTPNQRIEHAATTSTAQSANAPVRAPAVPSASRRLSAGIPSSDLRQQAGQQNNAQAARFELVDERNDFKRSAAVNRSSDLTLSAANIREMLQGSANAETRGLDTGDSTTRNSIGPSQTQALSNINATPTASAPRESEEISASGTIQAAVQRQSPEAADAVQSQIQRFIAMRARQPGHVSLQLHPRELGRLDLDFRQEGADIQVQIVARDPGTKELLEAMAPRLRASLAEMGIDLSELDVRSEQKEPSSEEREGRDSDSEHLASDPLTDPETQPNLSTESQGGLHITV